ncbi:MAG: hypothetical protein PHQ17_02365 [Methanobacterium sp.]|mgnify:CR=1 FL=1|jgi:hypothetical protein|nr:hypothetical protein [Methanobacterium sp.]
MAQCKITVLKTTLQKEIAEEFCQSEVSVLPFIRRRADVYH